MTSRVIIRFISILAIFTISISYGVGYGAPSSEPPACMPNTGCGPITCKYPQYGGVQTCSCDAGYKCDGTMGVHSKDASGTQTCLGKCVVISTEPPACMPNTGCGPITCKYPQYGGVQTCSCDAGYRCDGTMGVHSTDGSGTQTCLGKCVVITGSGSSGSNTLISTSGPLVAHQPLNLNSGNISARPFP